MKTLITLVVLVALIGLMGAITYTERAQANPPRSLVPYTIVWRAYVNFADGRKAETFTETRYVSSRDSWRSIKVFADGTKEESFAEKGRGMFLVDQTEKILYRLGHYRRAQNPEKMRDSGRFSHSEKILGHNVYVMRHKDGDKDVQAYYAPGLNGDLIKHVVRHNGSTMVLEPVSISLGEPARELMRHTEFSRVTMLPANRIARFKHGVRKK